MNILIVYDSTYGNTEKVARAIAGAFAPSHAVTVMRVGDANAAALTSTDLLIVGSPTHGGRATPAVQEFVSRIPANALTNVGVTAFDTRFSASEKGFGLRLLMRLVGYAAGRIAKSLQAKGGHLAASPEGFIVEDKEGPLKEGELMRAAAWAQHTVVTQQASFQVA